MSGVRSRRVARSFLIALALCAWCGWVSGFHHSMTPALAAWSASLAGVVGIDLLMWRGGHGGRLGLPRRPAAAAWPPPGRESRVLRGIWPWLVLVLVVVVWEVLGIDTGPHQAHLTVSALALAFRPFDAALLLAWILVGLGYGAARAAAPEATPGQAGRMRRPEVSAGAVAVLGPHPGPAPALLLPDNRAAGVAFWAGLTVVCVLVEVASRRSGGRLATAEEFVRLVSGPPAANALFVVAWAYAGWHLFAH